MMVEDRRVLSLRRKILIMSKKKNNKSRSQQNNSRGKEMEGGILRK
jgi:hypothetical protein